MKNNIVYCALHFMNDDDMKKLLFSRLDLAWVTDMIGRSRTSTGTSIQYHEVVNFLCNCTADDCEKILFVVEEVDARNWCKVVRPMFDLWVQAWKMVTTVTIGLLCGYAYSQKGLLMFAAEAVLRAPSR